MPIVSIRIAPEPLTSDVARRLITALNEELTARYPEEGTDMHFRLDPEEVAPGRGTFLVVRAGTHAIGCGAVRMLAPGTAEIKRMYVAPEARGRRLGARMLAALEEEAVKLGAREVLLETGPRQPEAIALYRRSGYVETGAFGEYTTHPLSTFMRKSLETRSGGEE